LGRKQPKPALLRFDRIETGKYIASKIEADGPGLALALAAGGSVFHTASFGLADVREGLPVKENTILHLGSCGKQFTGLGLLILAEEGKLRLDDPVGKHIPALAGFGPGVTIRRLLHHTSGVRDFYGEDCAGEILARSARPSNADLIRTYAELGCPMAKQDIEPGSTFCYSNSGYELLGAVIEAVSGQPYHSFFSSRVFGRLKMKDTFSVPGRPIDGRRRRATGYMLGKRGELVEAGTSEFDGLVGAGSFYTTVADLCLYDRALRANSLVSKASMQTAFTPGRTNDGRSTNYGFGWFLGSQKGIPFADHFGTWNGFQSYIRHYTGLPLSIFALSNNPEIDLLEIADALAETCRTPGRDASC
jgi:CubicO group peptidase (beta-lactamase class C family)